MRRGTLAMSDTSTVERKLHPQITSRLRGIQKQLMGVHESGEGMSTATKGTEREAFVKTFLEAIFPTQYRFGSGDIVDSSAHGKSGQVDVVVEYPFSPSVPSIQQGPRLYLADGVAAVIEIKSNLKSQWDEVRKTSEQIRPLKQKDPRGTFVRMGGHNSFEGRLPIFAVGYTGWTKQATILEHLNENVVDGILIIESGFFASRAPIEIRSEGPEGLWSLVCNLLAIMAPKATGILDAIDYFVPN